MSRLITPVPGAWNVPFHRRRPRDRNRLRKRAVALRRPRRSGAPPPRPPREDRRFPENPSRSLRTKSFRSSTMRLMRSALSRQSASRAGNASLISAKRNAGEGHRAVSRGVSSSGSGIGESGPQDRQVEEDHRRRVVDLMRHPGSYLPQGGQPAGLPGFLAQQRPSLKYHWPIR